MRIYFLLTALAVASNVQAGETTEIGSQVVHVTGTRLGDPMAWRYSLLRTAQTTFDRYAATQAPGAMLTFKLPNVDEIESDGQVAIVTADNRIPLPMVSPASFVLVNSVEATDDHAMVVVNKNFSKGSFGHPKVQVRSPGLPEGVKRMGDLRLACAAQMAMAKAESFKFRAIFAAASLFGDVCEEMAVTNIDAPAGPYDTMMIEDGERKLTRSKSQEKVPRLGEKDWSDNARISYLLGGQIVN
jgi:hypothetical protein